MSRCRHKHRKYIGKQELERTSVEYKHWCEYSYCYDFYNVVYWCPECGSIKKILKGRESSDRYVVVLRDGNWEKPSKYKKETKSEQALKQYSETFKNWLNGTWPEKGKT